MIRYELDKYPRDCFSTTGSRGILSFMFTYVWIKKSDGEIIIKYVVDKYIEAMLENSRASRYVMPMFAFVWFIWRCLVASGRRHVAP